MRNQANTSCLSLLFHTGCGWDVILIRRRIHSLELDDGKNEASPNRHDTKQHRYDRSNCHICTLLKSITESIILYRREAFSVEQIWAGGVADPCIRDIEYQAHATQLQD